MRARTRAVAATAGAALVVVPLSGAAAVALVAQEDVNATVTPELLAVADEQPEITAEQIEIAAGVEAPVDIEFDIEVPEIDVKMDPPPAPAPVARTAPAAGGAGSTAAARPVANSSSVSAAISGSAVIAEAAKYVGTPYRSGGNSPAGFDCSGFINYVYAQLGISLPRSSGAYYNVGTRVSSPQPGDIIVTPGHVGIYAGPNLQIDSPTHGKTIQFRSIWQNNPVFVRVTG